MDILVCGNLSTDIRRSTAEQLSALARRRRFADAMGDTRLLESLLSQLLASASTDANYAQAQLAAAYLALLDCMIKVWRQEPLMPLINILACFVFRMSTSNNTYTFPNISIIIVVVYSLLSAHDAADQYGPPWTARCTIATPYGMKVVYSRPDNRAFPLTAVCRAAERGRCAALAAGTSRRAHPEAARPAGAQRYYVRPSWRCCGSLPAAVCTPGRASCGLRR